VRVSRALLSPSAHQVAIAGDVGLLRMDKSYLKMSITDYDYICKSCGSLQTPLVIDPSFEFVNVEEARRDCISVEDPAFKSIDGLTYVNNNAAENRLGFRGLLTLRADS